ncbi:MAG: hypothetical protein GX308_03035 [Epulopiscium sp.]|nr:hypothetical protein [Candidatus Epulonipiscium sp.]
MISLISVFFMIIVFGGIFALQIFLSINESRWIGLILPILNLSFTGFMIILSTLYVKEAFLNFSDRIIYLTLLFNVPTLVLLLIYFICRFIRKARYKNTLDQ